MASTAPTHPPAPGLGRRLWRSQGLRTLVAVGLLGWLLVESIGAMGGPEAIRAAYGMQLAWVAVPVQAVVAVSPFEWSVLFRRAPSVPSFFAAVAGKHGGAGAEQCVAHAEAAPDAPVGLASQLLPLSQEERMARLGGQVDLVVAEVLGGSVDHDTPLMDAGADSLSAVELRNTLHAELGGLPLPSTLLFDFPTISAMVEYVEEQLCGGASPAAGHCKRACAAAVGAAWPWRTRASKLPLRGPSLKQNWIFLCFGHF